jgi:hypothetical protein
MSSKMPSIWVVNCWAGVLVNPATGYRVQGWISEDGVVDITALGDITIPVGETDGGNTTQNVQIGGNIRSDTANAGTVTSSIVIYDSLGKAHSIEMTYTKATGIPTSEVDLTGNIKSDSTVDVAESPNAITIYDSVLG